MKKVWSDCKNVLCIRVDNMGDLMMSSPAMNALKETLACKITVLTSPKAYELAKLLPCIDDVMVCEAAWVKSENSDTPSEYLKLVQEIKKKNFDACVIFTVYSQNPMPAILLAYLAEIPLRLAYCRENPYHLLSNWVPETEPYTIIKHQVQRDLDLVAEIGASTTQPNFKLSLNNEALTSAQRKLYKRGINPNCSYLVFHCGVSEPKREYPADLWIETAKLASRTFGFPIIFTGSKNEKLAIDEIQKSLDKNCISCAGLFSLEEFTVVLKEAAVVISVNTGTIHLSAAVQTPTVVLYAQSNPQHTPWNVVNSVLDFSIPENLKSKNEIIHYVDQLLYSDRKPYPSPEEVCISIKEMLSISLNTAL